MAGLPSKSQPAKAVVIGPPSEWPPQKTFRRRAPWSGISFVRTVYQSRTVWASPMSLSHCVSEAVFQPPKPTPSIGLPCQ